MDPVTQNRAATAVQADQVSLDDAAYAYARHAAELPAEAPVRRRVREDVIRLALPFAGRLARRYRGRGEPLEDLEQVARLALVRAVDRYDAERGPFTPYAAATIVGELRRHFRDTTWGVHVPRRMQELSLEVGRAAGELTAELARAPTVAELSHRTGATDAEVRGAIETAAAYLPVSLNAPVGREGTAELGDLMGGVDSALGAVDDRVTVAALVDRLPDRERQLLALRFFANRTQSEIAAELGISQMHVSRLLSRALTGLRAAMLSDAPLDWQAEPALPTAHGLAVQARNLGGFTYLEVVGEVDRDNAARLRSRLLAAVRSCHDGVRVELARVPFLDAAGASALVAARRAADVRGVTLRLSNPQRYVRHVLLVSGLHPVVEPPLAGAAPPRRPPVPPAATL